MKNQGIKGIRKAIRKTYGEIAEGSRNGCGCTPSCCESEKPSKPEGISFGLGYSHKDLAPIPERANLGLGCGNPQNIASLKQGETVLDLGSGGGLDCFLAAKAVGGEGQVIGVDSTPEMVYRARENAEKANLKNVEFRLGEIENLPVSDHSVDVVISNCVINLSPEKTKVFKEAYRVLKNGGRLAIMDMVATAPLPNEVKKDYALYTGCLAGAAEIKQIESMLEKAGFINIRIRLLGRKNDPTQDRGARRKIEDWVISASIEGVKPSKR